MFDYNQPILEFPEPQQTPFTPICNLHAKTNTIQPSYLVENFNTNILSPPYPIVLSK